MKDSCQNLEKKLTQIMHTLIELEFLKRDIIDICDKEAPYFAQVVAKNSMFKVIHDRYVKLFVIDIHTLTNDSDNDYFNFFKLIRFCQTNMKHIKWHKPISYEDLEELKENLLNHSDTIKSIGDLRNNIFAHNYKNKEKLEIEYSLSDFWEVLSLLQDIFLKIDFHFKGFDSSRLFNHPIKNQAKLMKSLHELSKIREIFVDSLLNEKDLELKSVRNILQG